MDPKGPKMGMAKFPKEDHKNSFYANKRAMLRSLGGGQIKKKHIKTTAANLKALKDMLDEVWSKFEPKRDQNGWS